MGELCVDEFRLQKLKTNGKAYCKATFTERDLSHGYLSGNCHKFCVLWKTGEQPVDFEF